MTYGSARRWLTSVHQRASACIGLRSSTGVGPQPLTRNGWRLRLACTRQWTRIVLGGGQWAVGTGHWAVTAGRLEQEHCCAPPVAGLLLLNAIVAAHSAFQGPDAGRPYNPNPSPIMGRLWLATTLYLAGYSTKVEETSLRLIGLVWTEKHPDPAASSWPGQLGTAGICENL